MAHQWTAPSTLLSEWSEEEVAEWLSLKCKVSEKSLPAFERVGLLDGGLLDTLATDEHAKDLTDILDNELGDVLTSEKMRLKTELKKLNPQQTASSAGSSGSASMPEVFSAGNNQLRRVSFLGAGGFGECFKVMDTSDRGFALKVVKCATDVELNAVIEEALKMSAHVHANLVRCERAFIETCGAAKFACVQMELCAGGDLGKVRERREKTKQWFRAATLARWLREALSGLQFLHASNVVHRDVKPANMLLVESAGSGVDDPEMMSVKLGDFGLAKTVERVFSGVMASGKTGMGAGTPKYMPPEMWHGDEISPVSDVWSLGVSFVELASLMSPPGDTGIHRIVGSRSENVSEYLKRLEAWAPPDDNSEEGAGEGVSEGVREDLKDMLSFEAERRPTCDALLDRRQPPRPPDDSARNAQTLRELVRECAWSLYDILNKDERCRAVIDDARGWSAGLKTWRTENEDILQGVTAFVDAGASSSAKLWKDYDLHAVTLAHCRQREMGFLVRGWVSFSLEVFLLT